MMEIYHIKEFLGSKLVEYPKTVSTNRPGLVTCTAVLKIPEVR